MAPSNFLPPPASSTRFLFRTPSFGKPAYVSRFLHSNNSHASPLGFLSPRFCFLSSFMVNLPEIASVFLTYHLRLAHCTPAGRLHVTVDLPRTSSPRALLISPRTPGCCSWRALCRSSLLLPGELPASPSTHRPPASPAPTLRTSTAQPGGTRPLGHLRSVLILLIPLSVPLNGLGSTCCCQDSCPGAPDRSPAQPTAVWN